MEKINECFLKHWLVLLNNSLNPCSNGKNQRAETKGVIEKEYQGLNPCSNGKNQRVLNKYPDRFFGASLNPCSNGKNQRGRSPKPSNPTLWWSLNPCSNGKNQRELTLAMIKHWEEIVLILVLMEKINEKKLKKMIDVEQIKS